MTSTRSPSTVTATQLRWVLALTSTAYFMVILDTGALFTALPRMQRDLHADLASLQWTVNSYGIAFAAGIITAAALGDRFGRRRVFNLGLALFTLASAACALAPNAAGLVVARTAQGIGAAAVLPLSLTILTTAFPPQRRGMIVGIYGGLAGLAVASGPIVGGVVTEGLNWQWIFWLNVPIGLVATSLATRLLPESHGTPERLDLAGVALVTAGVVALVWALVRANEASGINYMAQRFGAVFAIAIASAVFSAHGNLSDPAAVTAGFRPALWSCVLFATLAALTSVAITARRSRASDTTDAADVVVA
jgi:MFS family permease